jgi:phenylpyruvate tautomerase PptA (4-oxalocrotonate tautomerase family)
MITQRISKDRSQGATATVIKSYLEYINLDQSRKPFKDERIKFKRSKMPLYDIEHVTPLSDAQQEQLAKTFTAIHTQRFHTPSFFINVRFTDVSTQKVFRGGVRRFYNRAILRTRVSENRTNEEYGRHCKDLIAAWDRIVVHGEDSGKTNGELGDKSLRTVWILGALTTAVELGIQRPTAGKEIEWLRENKGEFERLANEGDEDMEDLLEELRTREDFKGVWE